MPRSISCGARLSWPSGEVVAVDAPVLCRGRALSSAPGVILYQLQPLARGARSANRAQWRNTAMLGLVMFAADYGCLFWAEKVVASGLAAVICRHDPGVGIACGMAGCAKKERPTGESPGRHRARDRAGVVLLTIPAGLRNAGFQRRRLHPFAGDFLLGGGNSRSAVILICRAQITMSAGSADGVGRAVSLSALSHDGRAPAGWFTVRPPLERCTCVSRHGLSRFLCFDRGFQRIRLVDCAAISATRVSSYAYVNPVIALLLGLVPRRRRGLSSMQYAGSSASCWLGSLPRSPARRTSKTTDC